MKTLGRILAGLLLAGMVAVVIASLDHHGSGSPKSDTSLGQALSQDVAAAAATNAFTSWADSAAPMRNAPSPKAPLVRRLVRGEQLQVSLSGTDGWVAVLGPASDTIGFVRSDQFRTTPLPPLEVESWKWFSDPTFAGNGAVIWTAVVRNHSSEYIASVRLEFTTFDKEERVMDTDYSYATGLRPGGTASVKGYATYFGAEKTATIRIVE